MSKEAKELHELAKLAPPIPRPKYYWDPETIKYFSQYKGEKYKDDTCVLTRKVEDYVRYECDIEYNQAEGIKGWDGNDEFESMVSDLVMQCTYYRQNQ